MDKSHRTSENTPEQEARWSTWEELLLACAVNRHGTKNWDCVAVELQKRSSVPMMTLSPESCKLKYFHLTRRFYSGGVNGVGDEHSERTETAAPLLEELRKVRVAELKREVERYDLSILSLQSKVRTLTEERDRSLPEGESSDLAISGENRDIRSENKNEGHAVITPESNAGEPLTGEKDQQSVNESNSTDRKDVNARIGEKDDRKHSVAVRTGNGEDEPLKEEDGKPGRVGSCNCSSNSVEENPVLEAVKAEPVTDSADLFESVAESKGREESTKENSDVQSSVSKSRNTDNSDRANSRSRSCHERGHTNGSPTAKAMPAAYQPLIKFLQKIESHRLGYLFTRQLESQQTEDYKLLIRQHIDLGTIRTWLEEGRYIDCKAKFFRDLLVLVNNAIIFFRKKNTSEFTGAIELRQLISMEMSRAKLYSPPLKQKSIIKLKPFPKEENPKHSSKQDPKSLVVCHKRSSIVDPKSSRSSSGVDKKYQMVGRPDDRLIITKKRARETRTEKNFASTNPSKISAAVVPEKSQRKRENKPPKSENNNDDNKIIQFNTDLKKRGAANFLNRMKQSSSSNSGSLIHALKGTPLSADDSKAIQKRSLPKKVSDRPPKRAAAPTPQLSKPNLELDRSETLATKQAKKRSKR
ncbi:unnamed protein product [Cuscuta europaea]|uniref:Bromo domain-containing protein n=1 Tax=Cuscuta europaea TaxID=41803 RepID=A0A9P1DYW9_CUSEU|nr:unnamed protein product [Cuscuta europaea]